MSIIHLLDTIHRYLNTKKKLNVKESDLHEATRLNNKLLSDLKKFAKLQRIKNSDNLSKEVLIYTLLRSQKNHLEDNNMKYINSTTDNDQKSKNKQHQNISHKTG